MIDIKHDEPVKDSYKFIGYFEATDCIPNMASNGLANQLMSGHYFVSQFCLKHKVRDWLYRTGKPVLHYNQDDMTVLDRLGLTPDKACAMTSDELFEKELGYIDIRLFSTLDVGNYGKSKKIKISSRKKPAVTISEARSLDPVEIVKSSVSRCYDVMLDDNGNVSGSKFDNPRWIIPYGLFRFTGGIDGTLAQKYHLRGQDINDFFDALWHMFDFDGSVLRPAGSMRMVRLLVYRIPSSYHTDNPGISANAVYHQNLYVRSKANGYLTSIDDYVCNAAEQFSGLCLYERTCT